MCKTFAILAVLVVSVVSAAETAQKDPKAAAEQEALKPRNDLPGLSNFAKVSDMLYRGAQPTAEGFAELKKMGIKTIISLRSMHSDRESLEGTGLQYIRISAKAWHPEEEDVVKFLKIVLNPANQPVFVHCQHGADRTGMMVGVYRMTQQNWTAEKVVQEMDNFGRHPVFTEIIEYLKKFDAKKLQEKMDAIKDPKVDVIK